MVSRVSCFVSSASPGGYSIRMPCRHTLTDSAAIIITNLFFILSISVFNIYSYAFLLNCFHFGNSCFFVQFSRLKDIGKVLADIRWQSYENMPTYESDFHLFTPAMAEHRWCLSHMYFANAAIATSRR